MRQPPPDSDPQPPTPEPSIQQQANDSTMGSGMQAAHGDNNIQIQGDNNWIVNIINALSGQQSVAPVGDPARPKNQRLLLAEVKHEVTARLKQSLHNAVLINLGMESQPQQVSRLWDVEVKIGSKPPEPLPDTTTILEIFNSEEIAGRLLVLGAP